MSHSPVLVRIVIATEGYRRARRIGILATIIMVALRESAISIEEKSSRLAYLRVNATVSDGVLSVIDPGCCSLCSSMGWTGGVKAALFELDGYVINVVRHLADNVKF